MKYNVILITIDSLRADRLSCLGYHRSITPNLDKIAEKGCLFTEAISVGSNTRISFPGIFASTYPFILLRLHDRPYMQLPRECITITELLKEQGYNTLAFNSNPILTFRREYWRGFDVCDDPLREKSRNRFFYYLRILGKVVKSRIKREPYLPYPLPEKVGNRALSFLKNTKTPFFLWIHHVSVHVPYYPPKKFLSKVSAINVSYSRMRELNNKIQETPHMVSKADLLEVIDLYDAEVMNVDDHIGEFMEQLDDIGIDFNNTFFIITSDHGDEFGEHRGFIHSEKLYDELIRVPLIIVGPGFNPRKITEQVSLLSLAPTILSLTMNGKFANFLGNDLLPLMKHGIDGEDYVICEGCERDKPPYDFRARDKKIACRTRSWKYIYGEDGREELYDLLHDPMEKSNLRDRKVNVAENLKQKILEHLKMEERMAAVIKEKRRIRERIKASTSESGKRYKSSQYQRIDHGKSSPHQ